VFGRLLALAALALALAGCGESQRAAARQQGARVVAREQAGPRLLDLTIRSPALGRTAKVRLLTPEGWRPGDGRRWPQLWLLHGCCDTYASWSANTDIAKLRALRDVLVVMPEGGAVGFYSDWRRGPKWETFQLTELRELLERDFAAGTPRAVAGLSMGGYGAIAYAARRPGLFDAAASFSGVVTPLRNVRLTRTILALGGGTTDDLWGSPTTDREVWEAHDPLALAPRLEGTRLFLSAGDGRPGPFDEGDRGDVIEGSLRAQTATLARRLRALHIPTTVDLYGRGTHSWPYWQRELHRALPLLLGVRRNARG
jgi:diacylglycerol O-acyltransferase / trehalose O-mycolyltransferase